MYGKWNDMCNHSLLYHLLFTVSITYQNLLFLLLQCYYQIGFPISHPCQVILSAQPIYQQLLLVTSISIAYQLSSSPIIYLHEVIVPYTCNKSLIAFCYQLLLSLISICFPSKIFVSGILISYSSVTIKVLYSYSLPCQLLFSGIIVSLLHGSCSDYF